jgi:uncharacterized membrane protein
VEPVLDSRNFKLKKQVELTTVLPKELDSTMEEVEFRQEKYEQAIKTIQKLKHHCPRGVETLFDEETEESLQLHHLTRWRFVHFQSTSFPIIMMTRSCCSLFGVFWFSVLLLS